MSKYSHAISGNLDCLVLHINPLPYFLFSSFFSDLWKRKPLLLFFLSAEQASRPFPRPSEMGQNPGQPIQPLGHSRLTLARFPRPPLSLVSSSSAARSPVFLAAPHPLDPRAPTDSLDPLPLVLLAPPAPPPPRLSTNPAVASSSIAGCVQGTNPHGAVVSGHAVGGVPHTSARISLRAVPADLDLQGPFPRASSSFSFPPPPLISLVLCNRSPTHGRRTPASTRFSSGTPSNGRINTSLCALHPGASRLKPSSASAPCFASNSSSNSSADDLRSREIPRHQPPFREIR